MFAEQNHHTRDSALAPPSSEPRHTSIASRPLAPRCPSVRVMQSAGGLRGLTSDESWRDFVPPPTLDLHAAFRPFTPLLERGAPRQWLGGGAARSQLNAEDSDTQMSSACSECEHEDCPSPQHQSHQGLQYAHCDPVQTHSPGASATRGRARVVAARVVPVLVAGLEQGSTTEKALDALQALAHKWHQRAHAALQAQQPLLMCSIHYNVDLTASGLQQRYQRARKKLLQAAISMQQIPADLYAMLFDNQASKLSSSGAILLHEIAVVCLDCTHGAGTTVHNQKKWTPAEKAKLGGKANAIDNRTPDAVRSVRKRQGTDQASTPAFPKSIFSAESATMEQTESTAPQRLDTESWSRIDAAKRLPDGAEVDWTIGVARIPETWTLILSRKALFLEQLQASSVHESNADIVVRDISASTKVSAILDHVHSVLRRRFPSPAGLPAPALYVQKRAPPLQVPEPSNVGMSEPLSPNATNATTETEVSSEDDDDSEATLESVLPPSWR